MAAYDSWRLRPTRTASAGPKRAASRPTASTTRPKLAASFSADRARAPPAAVAVRSAMTAQTHATGHPSSAFRCRSSLAAATAGRGSGGPPPATARGRWPRPLVELQHRVGAAADRLTDPILRPIGPLAGDPQRLVGAANENCPQPGARGP